MGLTDDIARESLTEQLCREVVKKIAQYSENPETVKALQELGREMLDTLPDAPEWAEQYYRLFRQ